jgi:hypothetical protein
LYFSGNPAYYSGMSEKADFGGIFDGVQRPHDVITDPRDIASPTRSEIRKQLVESGYSLVSDFRSYKAALDLIAPTRGIFTITRMPPGFAPEDIRRQWVGVALPMRGYFEPSEGVTVMGREAIELLRHKSPDAHAWWQDYYEQLAKDNSLIEMDDLPEFLANVNFLVFDINCGDFKLV